MDILLQRHYIYLVPKIFIIAGEPSGDLHGSFLIKSLLHSNRELKVKGWGGELMDEAGCEVLRSLDKLAFMGFGEVIKNISVVKENFKLSKGQIKAFDPDLVLFIDYPGFNLRIAKWAKKEGYQTAMYIAPQTWAWKEYRVKQIRAYVDKLFVILPFEEPYFNSHSIDATYYGHPLIEEINEYEFSNKFLAENKIEVDKPIISLFPGSRKQEVQCILPIMLKSVKQLHKHQIVIAGVKHLAEQLYQGIISNTESNNIKLLFNENYNILANSNLALISSGTATLEAAILGVPQIVCYKTSKLNYTIAKLLVKLKHISLVNLIMEESIVPELIQEELNETNLKKHIVDLSQVEVRSEMTSKFEELKVMLKGENTSELIAQDLLKLIV